MNRRATQPEGVLVAAVLRWLTHRGCYAIRCNTGAYKTPDGRFIRFGVPGMADVLAVAPPNGRALWVECKTEVGRVTVSQNVFIQQMQELGALALVVRPDDYTDLIDAALGITEITP